MTKIDLMREFAFFKQMFMNVGVKRSASADPLE